MSRTPRAVPPIPSPPEPDPLPALRKIVVNAIEREMLFKHHFDRIDASNWTVVNARIELPGSISWESEPHYGSFYAVGFLDEFESQWQAAGAVIVEFISNKEIKSAVRSWIFAGKRQKGKESIESAIVRLGGYPQLALNLSLPWFDEGLLSTEITALTGLIMELVRVVTQAHVALLQTGSQEPIKFEYSLHAVSELALMMTIRNFEALGWIVTIEKTITRGAVKKVKRIWKMTRMISN